MAKRKAIRPTREPNGKLSRASMDLVEAQSPAAVRRLRAAAISRQEAAEYGTRIGWLWMTGRLDASLYEALRRFAALWADYCSTMGLPGYPHSAPFTLEPRSAPPDPDSEKGVAVAERDQQIRGDMERAVDVLMGAGGEVYEVVCAVALSDELPGTYARYLELRKGAELLAVEWGLTTR